MPYSIIKQNNGFKVCKKNNTDKCFSNKPLTRQRALKQLRAIIINENKDTIKVKPKKVKQIAGKRCW